MGESRKSTTLPDRGRWAESYELGNRAMKEAGRWVLGIVAGLLLAATNLTGFGRLYPDQWRFWLAVIAALITVTTVGRIIYLFVQVQITEEMDWEKLTPDQFSLVQGYGFMKEYASFEDFEEDRQKTLSDYEKVRSSIGSTALVFNQQHNNDLLNRQGTLSEKLEDMVWQRHNIEAVLGYVPVKQRFEKARMALIRLGLVAALATLTLVWAVNGPEPQSQTIIAVPSAATQYPLIAEATGSRIG
ncbi:MAG: hypothetical protein ACR2OE_04645 [Thermomicrobiales bacterium]